MSPFVGPDISLILDMGKQFLFYFLILPLVISCAELSNQQANSQKMKDGMKDHVITRVTQDQIINAAYEQGAQLLVIVEQQSIDMGYWDSPAGKKALDSTNQAMGHMGLRLISSKETTLDLLPEESALYEAYEYSLANSQSASENVQNTEGEFLLFTAPAAVDGSFAGMWSFRLAKKTLIRNL
jgi:hypothetical protein